MAASSRGRVPSYMCGCIIVIYLIMIMKCIYNITCIARRDGFLKCISTSSHRKNKYSSPYNAVIKT